MLECSFLIARARDAKISDGKLHTLAKWRWLEEELFDRFGGGPTIAPGFYKGFWKDPRSKTRVADESKKYIIALPKQDLASCAKSCARLVPFLHNSPCT